VNCDLFCIHSVLINIFYCSDEPDAEERCHENLKEAFKNDKDNIEAHLSMANLRLVRNNNKDAKVHLT